MHTVLEFHVSPGEESNYTLELFKRGSSQPLIISSFKYDLSYMTDFEVRQLDVSDKDPQGRLDRLQKFGRDLYTRVFTDDLEKIWQEHKVNSDFLSLCLRLAPEANKLAALPWETLHDGQEYIAAGVKTGLSRLPLDIALQDDLPALPIPLKMLAFISSPLDLKENERLIIEREQEILLKAANGPSGLGRLSIDFEDEAKLPILEKALEENYQIFHYSGHGIPPESGGGLLLEDLEGKKKPVSVNEILQSLQKGAKDLRLAIISGCQTARTSHIEGFRDLARGLLNHKIPAIMAMQFSITDRGGSLFAEALYPRLIEGQSLEMAVSASRRLLLQNNEAHIKGDAFAPVLFLANSEPLKIILSETRQTVPQPEIDFSLARILPRLDYGFYGRRKEYRAIRDGLIHQNHRAILIYGIGGIGKTALASHVVDRLGGQFQGVYAFDFRRSGLAPESILLELHRYLENRGINTLEKLIHQSLPPDQLAGYLSQVLEQAPLLLIFDNFEPYLAPRENGPHEIMDENLRTFLNTLVKTTAQGSRFLFTSRYLFELDERRTGGIQEVPLNDLSRPEALGLMQKLPHVAASSYQEKLEAFKTFGGHPYALVTLDRHCARKNLERVLVDAKQVHAKLREFLSIELNYRSLSEDGRDLLNRLSAFREPVGFNAVHWVLGEKVKPEKDYLKQFIPDKLPEELQSLSEEELLNQVENQLPERRQAEDMDASINELIGWGLLSPLVLEDGDKVLSVHSLVRDFCRDKQEGDIWLNRLREVAAYYTNRSKELRMNGREMDSVFSQLEAFELLFEAGDFEETASILINVTQLLDRWGFGRYRESLYNRIIPEVKRETRASLVHNLGILYANRGEYDKALALYEESLKLFEEIGNRSGVAVSLLQIGIIHHHRGEYDKAMTQYEESLEIEEEIGNRSGAAKSLHGIGNIHFVWNEYDKALNRYNESLRIFEEIGKRSDMAGVIHQIGIIHDKRGELDKALNRYEESLKIKEEIGDRSGVASSFHQIGMIHQERGEYDKALARYEESLKITEEIGNRSGVAHSLHQIGNIHYLRDEYYKALDRYEESLKIEEEIGDRAGVANSLHQIGMLHQNRGEYDMALARYEESLKIEEEIGDRTGMAGSQTNIGQLLFEQGKYAQSFQYSLIALSILAELKSPDSAIVLRDLKRLRAAWGADNFDTAWKEKTGGEVLDILKEDGEGVEDE